MILRVSAPMARPQKTGAAHPLATAGEAVAAVRFEWIADGCTVVSFWTALRRLIVALEGCPGFKGLTVRTPAVPTESQ